VLRIDPPIDPAAAPLEDTMQRLADLASERITADPAAWWLWAWVGKFFPDPPP
jgi:lauroyl/myristoyl acyltransferase